MKPCSVCGKDEFGPAKGVFWNLDSSPAAIAADCPCGNTRAIPWALATEPLRHEAYLAERARLAVDGLI